MFHGCRKYAFCLSFVLFVSFLGGLAGAQSAKISKNTPGFIKNAKDLGATNPSAVISVTVWLNLQNENKLDQLVKQQYQKGSGNYHKWITQDQFNASFGPSAQSVKSVQNFLSAHKLTVIEMAENNMYVKAQGTVDAIQKAFHVQIHNYGFKGQIYRSNNSDPSINDAAGVHVAAVTGLDDYGFQPNVVRPMDGEGAQGRFVPLGKATPAGLFFEGQCFSPAETQTFTAGGN